MRWQGGIEAMAQTEAQRASSRGAVAVRLLRELAPYRGTLSVALLFIGINMLCQVSAPLVIADAIDHNISRHDRGGLAGSMALLFGVYVVGVMSGRGQVRRVGAVGQHLLATMRERLFDQLQRLPLAYFDKRPLGDLMSRLLSDVDTLNQFLSQGVTQLLGALLGLVGILIVMLRKNLELALVCDTIIPVMILTTSLFAARARAAYRKTRETVGNVTAELQEEIVGVRQAQAFNRTDVNIDRFRARNAKNRDANVAAVGVTSAFSPTIDVLSTLSIALVIGYGGRMVLSGRLTIGLLAAFLIFVQQFFRPVQLAASVYTLMQSALAGSERIYSILDEKREPEDLPGAVVLDRVEGRIALEHVSFHYDPTRPVLDDVSLEIAAGQTVALVGKTGAGKTTIASLIPRFYDVTSGVLRIDGHDVKGVTRRSLRAQMGMVLQEPFLFSGSLAANIAYGRPDARQDEIEAAARTVDAHDFISALPKGYETVLGEGGGTLSQGQRQLVAFARAVLSNPRILILDEATANIDTRTEAIVQKALGTLLRGRTSVVVAHRLSTIRTADLIVVVDAGRIVERGSHDSLIAADGVYADLYRRQFREPAPSARLAEVG